MTKAIFCENTVFLYTKPFIYWESWGELAKVFFYSGEILDRSFVNEPPDFW